MSSLLSPVFLTCVVFIAALAAPAAQAPPERPWSIKVYIANNGIAVNNGSPASHDQTKVWARPGGTVTFVIENHDAVAHDVRIPINEFVPSPKPEHKGDATKDPMQAGQNDTLTVNAGEVRVLVLKVKTASHFGFDKEPWKSAHSVGMTYKYNIHTTRSGGKKMDLDPDIEIIQP